MQNLFTMAHRSPLPIHFIFGLSDDAHERTFLFSHYLAVRAAHRFLQPATLFFHHEHEPERDNPPHYWRRRRK